MSKYRDLISVKGKNIVICGGSGLIGTVLVNAFIELGANVISADLKNISNSDIHVDFDLSSEASCAESFTRVLDRAGRVDGWINLAYPRNEKWGVDLSGTSQDSWDWHIQRHLGGYFWTSRLVLEHMKNFKTGSVINFSSIYGVVGPNFSIYEGLDMVNPPAYSAIKGGIVNLTRYLASYYGKDNLRVNCISPGGIFDHQNEEFVKRYNHNTPLGRMGNPDDMVGACVFLLSSSSAYVSGHNLLIDGGWSVV